VRAVNRDDVQSDPLTDPNVDALRGEGVPRHGDVDGSWRIDHFGYHCDEKGQCPGAESDRTVSCFSSSRLSFDEMHHLEGRR
jgi:hypothetical protein